MIKIGIIVTGHGEVSAAPILVRRVAQAVGVLHVEIPRPFRLKEGKLKNAAELERAVRFVGSKVEPHGGVLLLLDADDDCPARTAPQLLARARAAVPHLRLEVVMATREYEAWQAVSRYRSARCRAARLKLWRTSVQTSAR